MKRKLHIALFIIIGLSFGIYCDGGGGGGGKNKTDSSVSQVTMTGMTAKSASIDLAWTNPADVTLGRIDIAWTGASGSGSAQSAGGGAEYTITGLSATAEYAISLTVVDSSGKSSDAVSFSVSTSDTDKTYYFIYTAADLNAVRGGVTGYDNWTLAGNYILMADISLSDYTSGEGWEPIGTYYYNSGTGTITNNGFTGIFDGNGHVISNLTINRPDTANYYAQGLFGSLDGGTVKNLSITKCTISGNICIGGLAGYAAGEITITRCSVSGTVSGAGYCIGGLIGIVNKTSSSNKNDVVRCSASGSVSSSTNGDIGGLIGYTSYTNVSGCSSSASVNGCNKNIGGLIGYAYASPIDSSYATGNVSSEGGAGYETNIGGLIGSNKYSDITNSYATGNVYANDDSGYGISAGGLTGYALEGSSIASSYATGTISLTSSVSNSCYAGGLAGYMENSTAENCYTRGAISASTSYYINAGGFIGYSYKGNASYSYATADISGIVGISAGITASSSGGSDYEYYDGFLGYDDETAAGTYVANICNSETAGWSIYASHLTTTELKTESTFTTNTSPSWDFTDIWAIGTLNNCYPYLRNNAPAK